MEPQYKRLFFGMEVHAPWPDHFPSGRLLDEAHRHMTLVFLGKVDFTKISLSELPTPTFKVGFAGQFDQCLFLPPRHTRCVAWHVSWLEETCAFDRFHQTLCEWLGKTDKHLPHVTLARCPLDKKAWESSFVPLPLFLTNIHLYESLGNSHYQSLWSFPLLAPFEEIEHVADLAFSIRGETFDQLFQHAELALAFIFPPLLPFFLPPNTLSSLESVIALLNEVVHHADKEIGCPFKAVSYHTDRVTKENVMHWEMIVDV